MRAQEIMNSTTHPHRRRLTARPFTELVVPLAVKYGKVVKQSVFSGAHLNQLVFDQSVVQGLVVGKNTTHMFVVGTAEKGARRGRGIPVRLNLRRGQRRQL